MAHVVMLDSAFAPTAEQASQLRTRAQLWGGYLGGKRAYHPWSPEDFATVRGAGFGVVGFYVGPQRGKFSDVLDAGVGQAAGVDAVELARERALGIEVPLVLDVEDGAVDADGVAYCEAWAAVGRSAGYHPGLYARPAVALAAGQLFDCLHVARYPDPTATDPTPESIPGLPDDFMPGRRAWQYHNSHPEAGMTVDTSVCDMWFLEVQQHMARNKPASAIAFTPSGQGYWIAAQDGGVFAFGDAQYLGGLADKPIPSPIVALAPTPSGNGYLLLASNGSVFPFGDAAAATQENRGAQVPEDGATAPDPEDAGGS